MAYPIEETPVLEGEFADAVIEEVCNPKKDIAKERFLKECSELFKHNQKKK